MPSTSRHRLHGLLDSIAGLVVIASTLSGGSAALYLLLAGRAASGPGSSTPIEVHPSLSRGQRRHDLEILVENVAQGWSTSPSDSGARGDAFHLDR